MILTVIAILGAALWQPLPVKSLPSPDPSIMELINLPRVDKLMSDRRIKEATTPESNSITEDSFLDDHADIAGNTVHSKRRGHHAGIPDINAVLADMHRDKLKTDDQGLLVGKKEIVRKDWCKTEPIIQRIREEGCQPKNVVNRFCYGQCNSFYIPKNLGPRKGRRKKDDLEEGGGTFRSCGVCKPKRTVWVQVTLNCPGQDPPLRRRRVQKIRQCQCLAENVV